ncbi:hypothetical protein EG68_08776, partial [Paragonimus skrjabini miyazakii]
KCQVIEFENESVGIVHKSWITQPGFALWPGLASTKHHRLLLDGVAAPTGSKLYKVKMHRVTGITNPFSSHFPNDLHLAYNYQRVLEQLSDIPSSDATDIMDRAGKRKRQPIVRSDFTYELEEKRKPTVYSVDIDYSPHPPPLQNMSQLSPPPKRCTLGSMENLPSFSNPIASSAPAARTDAACTSEVVKEVKGLKSVMENVMQNVRIREELHALRLEVNVLRFQHVAAGLSTTQLFPVHLPMKTLEDMQLLNVKLEDAALYKQLVCFMVLIHSTKLIFLTSVGGTSMGECTRNVMKTLMIDDVAKTSIGEG